LQNLISRRRGTVLTMADTITNQMESVKLRHILTPFLTSQAILTIKSDNATPEDWKARLKIPAKDTRQQTEVR
jgi:hypothetical protein